MVVVTNLGSVSYLVKNSKYDFEKAVVLLNEAIDLNSKVKNIKDLQEAADYFLKNYYNVGINYPSSVGELSPTSQADMISIRRTGDCYEL